MYMLIMVLDNSEYLDDVLQAWVDAGVPGVTILESTGVDRVLPREQAGSMFAGFSHIFGASRVGHNTLFAVIESMALAETAVQATEAIIGDMNNPRTGIMFTLPVAKTWGIPEPYANE
ncbi:MAG: hypothetical protein CSA11_06435 [Chloroflexi bacterium]|nr:MAG: hypothetical protein CSB13_02520 [Chloroflexota bacterium]PIE80860.1 MAG: hypothetical protein CSA11_06435 [Chloroflexota bacterium]